MIYLDNAATSWPKPQSVYQGIADSLSLGGNPGRGGHAGARKAAYIIYEAREEIAALLGADIPTNVVFTYNATDAMNMALLGTLCPGDRVITTSMEHNAVARPLRYLESQGVKLEIITVSGEGILPLDLLEAELAKGARAVVVGHASNVTGAVMPIRRIGRLAKEYQAMFIVDAAQTAGVEEINIEEAGIDILVFSGHKGLLGPQGTGGLYVRSAEWIRPFRYGGTGSLSEQDRQPEFLPDKLESGTPNTPGIAGLLNGLRFIKEVGVETIRDKERMLTMNILSGLREIDNIELYGPVDGRERTAVVSFNIKGMDCGEVTHILDTKYEIACRSGLHCAPWAHQTIGTLKAGTIRLSPGYFNTLEEVKTAIGAVREIAASCKERMGK
jgi:cysteine desulfurase family protein